MEGPYGGAKANYDHFGLLSVQKFLQRKISSHLKSLKLAFGDGITGKGLIKSVSKFPELEELHLSYMPYITARDFEAISKCCSMLKSFKFNGTGSRIPNVGDSYALSIAKNMPNLCYLQLFGNDLSDKGLRAILDGCPHLESLDIRRCFRVEL
ncbi:hypothetical protein CASFOL_014516 [Castilleja foliolosa]|uniref:Uncharacterized protein n=1 Tax=Castilleja foliolosa TaxID=1961234 RepID=A0ABD3DN37_9LAMI